MTLRRRDVNPLRNIKSKMPWWAKISAKLLLSRLPVRYEVWRRLNLFRHGAMDETAYAYGVFKYHFDRVKFPWRDDGFVGLELGPGDSLFSAMIGWAHGASALYLVDTGVFARADLNLICAMADFLVEKGLPAPKLEGVQSPEEVLAACNGRYLTAGLSSLREIPDESVDFIWSHAVLEHVKRAEFLPIMKELRRVVRPDGVCSHLVDFRDHLGGQLNNLRFSRRFWESELVATAGFYTNRIRYSEMLALIREADFDVEVTRIDRWSTLPTPRRKLSSDFKHLPDDELCVSGFDVILHPTRQQPSFVFCG